MRMQRIRTERNASTRISTFLQHVSNSTMRTRSGRVYDSNGIEALPPKAVEHVQEPTNTTYSIYVQCRGKVGAQISTHTHRASHELTSPTATELRDVAFAACARAIVEWRPDIFMPRAPVVLHDHLVSVMQLTRRICNLKPRLTPAESILAVAMCRERAKGRDLVLNPLASDCSTIAEECVRYALEDVHAHMPAGDQPMRLIRQPGSLILEYTPNLANIVVQVTPT